MFCIECGTNIATAAKFCPQCGAKIEAESPNGASDSVSAIPARPLEPVVATGATGQNAGSDSGTQTQAASPPEQLQSTAQPTSAIQVNVGVDMGRGPSMVLMVAPKSLALAIILALFFGPLGLLYSTVKGAVIMFCITFVVALVTLGFGYFFMTPICAIWAALATNAHNDALAAGSRPQ